MTAGIEPDDCFYIQHQALVVGKDRIDLTLDPPPDLAIEVDVTSTTELRVYAALRVPEIRRYHNRTLQIYVWHAGQYVESPGSPTFLQLPVIEGIEQFVEMSRMSGTAPALRAFRQWVRAHIRP